MASGFTSIEYEETVRLASELERIAQDCSGVSSKTTNMIGTLEPGWQGSSGDLMIEVLNLWMNKQKKISQNMDAVSKQIKMVADSLKAADDDSAQRNQGA